MTDRDIVDDMALRVIAFCRGTAKPVTLQAIPEMADDGPVILISPRVVDRIREITTRPEGRE